MPSDNSLWTHSMETRIALLLLGIQLLAVLVSIYLVIRRQKKILSVINAMQSEHSILVAAGRRWLAGKLTEEVTAKARESRTESQIS